MSSTTQILFNSPALHALKRDQLVKLCKLHNLKATGKNAELIERLTQRAAELPPELAEIADEAGDEGASSAAIFNLSTVSTVPSEQWEIVMDDIEEVDEENGTLGSKQPLRGKGNAGEFGTNASKSSVATSLKAFANSLGIKRAGARKSTASTLASTSSVPANVVSNIGVNDQTLSTNPFEAKPREPPAEPIPGNRSRPGVPAPPNARLSASMGATTIRLISESYGPMPSPPRLTPHPTTFDLDMGTPSAGAKVWPATPGTAGRLYPTVPYEDLKPTPITRFVVPDSLPDSVVNSPSPSKMKMREKQKQKEITDSEGGALEANPFIAPTTSRIELDKTKEESTLSVPTPARVAVLKQKLADKQDMFSPARVPGSAKRPAGRISAPQNEPFLFGSPLPQHKMTNKDFGQAANSVLEEMNKRLAEAGVTKVDENILSGERKPTDVFGVAGKPGQKRTENGDRFAKVHDEAFNKMDSIVNHYAAKRVLQPAGNAGEVPGSNKRKSNALVAHARATPAVKRRSVASARAISQEPRKNTIPGGFGDEAESDEEEAREEEASDRRASKRMRVVETADVHKGRRMSFLISQQDQTVAEREKNEKRKERERDAVKRKLEASRARRRSSMGSRASIVKVVPPPKPPRAGFLASAKSLVRNVWSMGAAGTIKPAAGTTVAKPMLAPKVLAKTADTSKGHTRVPSGSTLHKPTSSSVAKTQPTQANQASSTSSRRSRPRIPSFSGTLNATGSLASRTTPTDTLQSNTTATRASSKPTSTQATGASSMGARKNLAPLVQTNVSSLGVRKIMAPPAAPKPRVPSGSEPTITINTNRKRTISTLMAPTQSSLAKRAMLTGIVSRETTPSLNVNENRPFASPITNNLHSPRSPRPQQIFSKPLDGFGSPNSSPGATEKQAQATQSLVGAASTLLARASENENATAQSSQAQLRQQQQKPTSLIPRKPRISRSGVIANLGAQRATVGTAAATTTSATVSASGLRPSARARSSIGAIPRQSLSMKQNRVSGAEVLMSAKKKVRQSEMARRKSRMVGSAVSVAPTGGSVDVSMDIDD